MQSHMTDKQIRDVFVECDDFVTRQLSCRTMTLYAYAIDGLVASAFASQYILRPITDHLMGQTMDELYHNALSGQIYNWSLKTFILYFPFLWYVSMMHKRVALKGYGHIEFQNMTLCGKNAFEDVIKEH